MKQYLKECLKIVKALVTSPFEDMFLGEAIQGLQDIAAFLLIVIISLSFLAVFPLSVPALVYLDRRSKRLDEERRERFLTAVKNRTLEKL